MEPTWLHLQPVPSISKEAALVSEHATSGMHCRFPGGKRSPALLDREKQGYECDAPKVIDPPRGQHSRAQWKVVHSSAQE